VINKLSQRSREPLINTKGNMEMSMVPMILEQCTHKDLLHPKSRASKDTKVLIVNYQLFFLMQQPPNFFPFQNFRIP